jgi:tetratricopeptide (TPR) repeat protein
MFSFSPCPVVAVSLALTLGAGWCREPDVHQPRPAPFFENLGSHHHTVTTDSESAQRYFNQGLILTYAFNHKEAVRAFEAAAKLDPECAMAWWGVALAYGPNINAPMDPASVPKAWLALQKALALKSGVSEREQAYIDALATRYEAEPVEDRSALDAAFAAAMREVASKYPDDLDAAALYAEAIMDTTAWDYWTVNGTLKPSMQEAMAELRRVLSRNPEHPGALHLLIHAVEAGPTPEDALAAADTLRGLVPGAGHLVHMPSHIYVRTGRYHDATEVNLEAAEADETYIASCRAQGFYPGLYYPHNVHFIWFAMTMEGRKDGSLAAAAKASQYALDKRCGAAEGPRLRYLPLLAMARYGMWDDILKRGEPSTELAFDRALSHFARGLALVGKGDASAAEAELEKLRALAASDELKSVDSIYLPAIGIAQVATLTLAGRIAHANGNTDQAITALGQAVAAADALPYMEPPFWHYPIRLTLGSVQLESGASEDAEQTFRDCLDRWPRNGWALFGLEQALRAQERAFAADNVRREFALAWQYAEVTPDLAWY